MSIAAKDLWPAIGHDIRVLIDLNNLSIFEFRDMSTNSTWISSDTMMNNVNFVIGNTRHRRRWMNGEAETS